MRESYLSFKEYRQVCRELEEGDEAEQEELAANLHKLGIALNYKDDPEARDTHVLNPHWVTEGIYRILNAPRLERRKGVLRPEDLPQILPADNYPRQMHLFVLDLMRKFELCFLFPEEKRGYLVPELLPKQQPEEVDEYSDEKCLGFDYKYPILPEGLIPRFIVNSHMLSDSDPRFRWRSGVILSFEGCRALVKGDVTEKTVTVRVSGTTTRRRQLLAVVRSYLEHIHSSFRDLNPEERVPIPGHPGHWVPYQKLLTFELAGITSFHEDIDGNVITLIVADLLDGVDLAAGRPTTDRCPGPGRSPTAHLFQLLSGRLEIS